MRNAGGMDSGKARALASFPCLAAIAPKLDVYETMLRRWQRAVQLVAPSTLDDLWWRHFADSAQAWETLIPIVQVSPSPDVTHVDLGSGGGFPGLVIALLNRSRTIDVATTLVESDTRKAAFLREVSRETDADATVVTERAEHLISKRATPTIVTSRAFAPPTAQVSLLQPWLDGGTAAVLLMGEAYAPDPTHNLCANAVPSRTGAGFVVTLRAREAERP